MIHAAEVLLPITTAPIDHGAVLVEGDHITDVGRLEELIVRHPDSEVHTWPGAMMPGLVNAHTHLQYTTFDRVGAVRYPDYVAWAVRFVEEYDARPHEDWPAAVDAGIDLSLAAGVTAIADVVTDWEARDVMAGRGIPGIAYLELIGTDSAAWSSGVRERLIESVTSAPTTDWFRVGISPHAPYSVDEHVLAALAETARSLGVRLHVHVAEIDSEDELYRTGTGVWADRVRQVSSRRSSLLERGGSGMGSAEFATSLGLLGPDCHIAHGVYLDRQGRAMLKQAGTVAALCPRSNITVGLEPPPVADYLFEDVPFAVGTDSLGSAPSLDPMDDVAMLRRLALEAGYERPDLDRRLLEGATLGGARAMGLDHLLGSIEIGKRADLAVFDCSTGAEDAEAALAAGGGSRCVATLVGGRSR